MAMKKANFRDNSVDAGSMSRQEMLQHLAELEQRKAQLDAVLQQVSGLSQHDDSLRDIATLIRNSARQEATEPVKEQQARLSSVRKNVATPVRDGEDDTDTSVDSEDVAKLTELSATKRRLDRLGQLADRFQQLRSAPANANANGTNEDSNAAGEALDERERLLSLQRRLDALRSVLPSATKLLDDDEVETFEQSRPDVPKPNANATERQLESAVQRKITSHAAELAEDLLPEVVTNQTSFSDNGNAERQPRVNSISGATETKLDTTYTLPDVDNAVLSSMSAQLNSTTTLCETLALGQQRLHTLLSTLASTRAESGAGLTNGSELQAATINAQLPLTVAHCQQSLLYQHAEIQQLKRAVDVLLSREGLITANGVQTFSQNAAIIHKNPDAASSPSSVAGTISSAASQLQYRSADLNSDRESSASRALRANVYAEASTLISLNKASPKYLVELFTELNRLSNDEQRSNMLRAVRDCVLRMNIRNGEAYGSGSEGDLSSRLNFLMAKAEAGNPIEVFVYELNKKLEEMLRRLTALTTVATIGAQLKTYVIDKLSATGFCSIFSSEDVLDVANSRFFVSRLESAIAKAISKYCNERVCDCCDELLADIADVLRTELNYLTNYRQ